MRPYRSAVERIEAEVEDWACYARVRDSRQAGVVPPTGLEPVLLASEASALSTELRGRVSLYEVAWRSRK